MIVINKNATLVNKHSHQQNYVTDQIQMSNYDASGIGHAGVKRSKSTKSAQSGLRVGLQNEGNNCFASSAIQVPILIPVVLALAFACLMPVYPFRSYQIRSQPRY